jgi:hypothetical protein
MNSRIPATPPSAGGSATDRICMISRSAWSSSPSEGAGKPCASAAPARLTSAPDGEPGGWPAVSTRPLSESTVQIAAGTGVEGTNPGVVSSAAGATCTTTTPGRTLRWIAFGRQLASAHSAAAVAAARGSWPGPEKIRNAGVAPCCRYAIREELPAKDANRESVGPARR